MAVIGDILTAPEVGWRRYNDSDSRILYENFTNLHSSQTGAYNNDLSFSTTTKGSIIFKFKGTKLRILTQSSPNRADSHIINIDNVDYTYSEKNPSSAINMVLNYEIVGLDNTVHTIVITSGSNGTYPISLDAIDIDDTGHLVHPILTEKTSFKDMQIGDVIRFRYSSLSSGAVGAFSFADTITPNEIPFSSSSTPDGIGYFIMVGYDSLGRKKLVADRVIQQSISWDTLNKEGVVSEKVQFFSLLSPLKSNSEQGYTVSASSTYSTCQPYFAFDKNNLSETSTPWITNGVVSGKLAITLPQATIVNCYSIHGQMFSNSTTLSEILARNPKSWTLEGSVDGNTWIVLDTQTNFTNWGTTNAEKRYFKFNNDKVYKQYRINITANNGSMYTAIGELDMYYIPKNYSASIRLLTGGISATDKDNEWDKIIVESNLGGKITPGDNNVWHWNGLGSWTSTTGTTSANRVARGNTSVDNYVGITASSWLGTTGGFRPVLLVESLSLYKYLIKQGDSYYTLKSEFYQNGTYSPLTLDGVDKPNDNDFKNNGFDDLSILTNVVGGQCVEENTPSILGSGEVFTFDIKDDFDSLINIG